MYKELKVGISMHAALERKTTLEGKGRTIKVKYKMKQRTYRMLGLN